MTTTTAFQATLIDHVAEPHGDARAGVVELVADEVVLVVVAEGQRLDHEQQHEERDRVVEDLDHQALRSSSSRARSCASSACAAAIAAASARIAGGSFSSAVHARAVETHRVLADQRVEREPVGEVVGAVDDQVPERLVDRVAGVEVVFCRQHLGARLQLGAHHRARAGRAAAGCVGADARAHLHDRPLDLEPRRDLVELEQQLQPAVAAPVAHARGAALGDADEPRLLQPLERFADRVPARAEVLAEVAFRGQRVVLARQDRAAEMLVDAARDTGCTSHLNWLYQWRERTSTAAG